MSRLMTKPTKWHVRLAKTPISLGFHPVWSVFAVRMKKAWVLSYPLSAQQRLSSDWADAQTDLSLRWVQSFCWFCHEVAQIQIRTFLKFPELSVSLRFQEYTDSIKPNWKAEIYHCIRRTRGTMVLYCSSEIQCHSELPWTKIKEWPWPQVHVYLHVFIKFTIDTNFYIIDFNYKFLSNPPFNRFSIQMHKDQSWPLHRKVKGQTWLIIWTSLAVPESPMLYTKFQRQSAKWFQSRRFFKFLAAAILVMWPIFVPPIYGGSIWTSASTGLAGPEEMWNCWNLSDNGQSSKEQPWPLALNKSSCTCLVQ